MKALAFLISFLALVALSPSLLRAEQFRDAPTSDIVIEAIPASSYVSGDKGWNGGFYTNNYVAGMEFDANTCFVVLQTTDASLSATDIALRARDFIVKRFDFPTSQPSSTWEKSQPDKLSAADFGEVFLVTFPPKNTRDKQGYYLSVQVVRRASNEFGVTVQYSTVTKP